jgi:hypothetical protein
MTDWRFGDVWCATSREPVAVGESEASPVVHSAIASPKRECSDSAFLCIIKFLLPF